MLDEAGEGWVDWYSAQSFLSKFYVRTTAHLAIVKFDIDVWGKVSACVGVSTVGEDETNADPHGEQGDVAITYLRSKRFGLGNARCWIDDDEAHAVDFQGAWGESSLR